MAIFEVTDPVSGKTIELEGDSAPTEEELNNIFSGFSTTRQSTPVTGGTQSFIPEGEKPQSVEPDRGFIEGLKEEAPQIAGGIAGGMAGAAAGVPLGPVGIIAGGAVGAGLGGAAGKGYQQVYQHLTGSPDAPKTSKEAAINLAKAGAEEAAWDLGGNLALKMLNKSVHMVRPKAVDDIEKLSLKLESRGGRFTAAQRTDSWTVHQLDSLTRGSLTGSGVMKGADALNNEALKALEDDLRRRIAKNATLHLSDTEVGNLFLSSVQGGREAHKTLVGELYSGLDDLVPTKTVTGRVTENVVSDIIDPNTGKNMVTRVTKEVDDVIKPVHTDKLKEALTPYREQMERINWQGVDADSKSLINGIFSQDKTLTFGDAQALRSNLLDAQRALEGVTGKTKASGKVGVAVNEMSKAMDRAAAKQGPEVLEKYAKIKSQARKGYEIFNDKFIADLLANKKNPERIGEHIFRTGNVNEIMKAKKALRASAVYSGKSFDSTWNQMQAGYLDSLLRRSGDASTLAAGSTVENVLEEGLDVSGTRLIKEFTDPKKARTLTATFGKKTREDILDFAMIAERIQRRPEGGLGMLIQLTQGGALIALVKGAVTAGEATTTLLAPRILAKVMASEGGAKILATSLKTPTASKQAGVIATKLARLVAEASKDEEQNQ